MVWSICKILDAIAETAESVNIMELDFSNLQGIGMWDLKSGTGNSSSQSCEMDAVIFYLRDGSCILLDNKLYFEILRSVSNAGMDKREAKSDS